MPWLRAGGPWDGLRSVGGRVQVDGVGIVRGFNEDSMGVQGQLNYRTAGEGSFEHPPPLQLGIFKYSRPKAA